jgi:hypothetical protein
MTHCSDDDLVLHYYGESPDASAHVETCAACTERARDLAMLLSSVTDEVPERDAQYGADVWDRLRSAGMLSPANLPAAGRVRPVLRARPAYTRWALAAAATVAVVASSFFAGRYSMPARPTGAPTRAAMDTAGPQIARRVLLLSVADHLERSDRVLTDIMNTPEADLSVEQQWAGDLIAANRLYRQDAVDANEASLATVLDELERTLLDVVHRPADAPADLDQIRRRIDSAALLFKVRVLTNELRQRQLGPDASSTGATSPIS